MTAMDFFGHQERARRSSLRLLVLFALAVVGIVAAVYFAALPLAQDPDRTGLWRPDVALVVAIAVPALILTASLVRMLQLRAGGSAVATMLGGTRVAADDPRLSARQFVHVVEEIAIASGMPVPATFVLEDEAGLNAFAAGWGTDDAAITVTRGLLDALDRDQLQGVIAHEFSHIAHGDMRLNLRLMGVLFGIVCLSLVGRGILRAAVRGPRTRDRKGGGAALALFGLGLMAIGAIGALFAGWIRAAISRQREFLADASAVTWTRNPRGIGTALAVLAERGTGLQHARAAEASHLFFASGVRSWLGGLDATHPPIEERIERILPGYRAARRQGSEPLAAATTNAPAAPTPAPARHGGALPFAGAPDPDAGQRLLAALPPELLGAARDPAQASAVLVALLLAGTESAQPEPAATALPTATAAAARGLVHGVRARSATERLALLDLAIGALRARPAAERIELLRWVDRLTAADGRLSAFELALVATARRHLAPALPQGRRSAGRSLAQAHAAAETVLSLLAHAAGDDAAAARSFADGVSALDTGRPMQLQPRGAGDCARLSAALAELAQVTPLGRRELLAACARAAAADGILRDDEHALVRAIAENFGCPLPPGLPTAN